MNSCKACGNEKVMLCLNCFEEKKAFDIERLRVEIAEVRRQRDIYEDDFTCTQKRLNDALDQLRCPDCKCADQIDAESSECGCDSPICARNGEKTLAESWIALRARVAELEVANADTKRLVAEELAETFKLFGILGLNEADDFGTKTAIEAVHERIESIKADRDRWKAIADSRHAIIESLEWCQDSMDDDGTFRRCPTCSAFEPEIHESDCAVAKAIAESARAANGGGE